MENNVSLLDPYIINPQQPFLAWFADAWKAAGGKVHRDIKVPWKLKQAVGKYGLSIPVPRFRKNKLLVECAGRIEYFAWPWCYFYEIVPIIWDCWPRYHEGLLKAIKVMGIKQIFCTASQVADMVNEKCEGVRAIWIPEGLPANEYPMGGELKQRRMDVLRIGRDAGGKFLYPTHEDLTAAMRDSKVMICRPRCDTHPEHAGDIETLTLRYWEAMLSGCVIVGRAPRELIKVCGYNPVVENESESEVLTHIDDFQELVNKNRLTAEQHADWSYRIPKIMTMMGTDPAI